MCSRIFIIRPVADAKYRAAELAYDTTRQSHGNPQLIVTNFNFNVVSDNPKQALAYNKDGTWIQSTYSQLRNDDTAKSNTDFLMRFDTTSAAHHCRSQNISGAGQLDLPNLYELIILYLESDNIDALDPTASSNRDKALGKMNTRFGLALRTAPTTLGPSTTVAARTATSRTVTSAVLSQSKSSMPKNLASL